RIKANILKQLPKKKRLTRTVHAEDKTVAAEGISAGVIVGVVVAATLFTLIACVMCLKFRRKKSAVAARVKRANALLQEKAKDMRARDSVSTEFSTISAAEAAFKRNTQLVAGPTADALTPPDGGDKAKKEEKKKKKKKERKKSVLDVLVAGIKNFSRKEEKKSKTKMKHSKTGKKKRLVGAFNKIDTDNSGDISFEEFVAACQSDDTAGMRTLFDAIDTNKDGAISKSEFVSTLRKNPEAAALAKKFKAFRGLWHRHSSRKGKKKLKKKKSRMTVAKSERRRKKMMDRHRTLNRIGESPEEGGAEAEKKKKSKKKKSKKKDD
ncbi:MAG: hypothetical protein CMH57_04545, partial [Myxococcales bacterium]|nr:hypothetical protein [Myxococcales bacterium]